MTEKIPSLECPECGAEAIPATGRGRNTDDEFIEHRDGCRCSYCDWVWMDGTEVTCACGAKLITDVDDGYAYVRLTNEDELADAVTP
jgi:DNA-directed RNA polymerase subunit RPC12/RpoP